MFRSQSDINRARLVQVLDILAEDDRPNVYAGELEVRPPAAPTIRTRDKGLPSTLIEFREHSQYAIEKTLSVCIEPTNVLP
jgi:hypothetical protein